MRPTRLVLALGLAAMILSAGAFTAIASPALHLAAAAPTPKTNPKPGAARAQAYCDAFVTDLAHRLGVPTDKLKSSVKDSLKKSIDDAVTTGDLTPDQAKAKKAQIDAAAGCQGLQGWRGFGGHRGGAGAFGGARMNILEQVTNAAATALQQPAADVRKDVLGGQTLNRIADLKHISKVDFDAAFRAALKSQSDPQVTAGKLTAARQTKLIDQASAIADKLWGTSLKDLGGAFSKRGAPPAGTKPTATIQ